MDICGECDPDKSMESPKNDHANKELFKVLEKMVLSGENNL